MRFLWSVSVLLFSGSFFSFTGSLRSAKTLSAVITGQSIRSPKLTVVKVKSVSRRIKPAPELLIENATTSRGSNRNETGRFYCYFLSSGNLTYNGYTVDLDRRLRQHNGELAGGAQSTRWKGPWTILAALHSNDWTKRRAMQVEYTCKYPTGRNPRPRGYSRAEGRLASLQHVLNKLIVQREQTTLFIHPAYKEKFVYNHSEQSLTANLNSKQGTWTIDTAGFVRVCYDLEELWVK